ncbi:MAG: Ni/Fe hydrogenase subunit gamma, partial [Planctomycetaceae bacterium]|nr:Ni/Fe hydrogenase subunit gamma [Planctomycetaceae bacterium]
MSCSTAAAENPWLSHSARIDTIRQETPGVATYDLVLTNKALSFSFKPGQFNMLYLPGLGEIAISISGDPGQTGVIPHTIREAGLVTRALAELPLNSEIGIRGPFGSSWPVEEAVGKHVILVAGGIGLAPLRPAIYEILRRRREFGQVDVLVGARTPAGLLYPDEYDAWDAAGIQVQTTVDRGVAGWNGHV